jgi:hypothetical protein
MCVYPPPPPFVGMLKAMGGVSRPIVEKLPIFGQLETLLSAPDTVREYEQYLHTLIVRLASLKTALRLSSPLVAALELSDSSDLQAQLQAWAQVHDVHRRCYEQRITTARALLQALTHVLHGFKDLHQQLTDMDATNCTQTQRFSQQLAVVSIRFRTVSRQVLDQMAQARPPTLALLHDKQRAMDTERSVDDTLTRIQDVNHAIAQIKIAGIYLIAVRTCVQNAQLEHANTALTAMSSQQQISAHADNIRHAVAALELRIAKQDHVVLECTHALARDALVLVGIDQTISTLIHKRYLRLSVTMHPDKVHGLVGEAKMAAELAFINIVKAHEKLMDVPVRFIFCLLHSLNPF